MSETGLRILAIRRDGGSYRLFDVDPSDDEGIARIAVITGALDRTTSELAWACDLIAVATPARVVVTDTVLARSSLAARSGLRSGDVLDAPQLEAHGLAPLRIDLDARPARDQLQSLVDPIVSLIRSRPPIALRPRATSAAIACEWHAIERCVTLRLPKSPLPCFTIPVLEELDALFTLWRRDGIDADALILAGASPTTFSMGGDLATIADLARRRDLATLRHYARLSVQVVHDLWTGLDRGIVTVAAVEGEALGSGFEAVLACHAAVAAPTASFAFPESRFGLFPGMGATSLLGRRNSQELAEHLILTRRRIAVEEALRLGFVDHMAEDACPVTTARRLFGRADPRASESITASLDRRRALPRYDLAEALTVVDMWVEAVLALSESNIKEIERIARVQSRRKR